MSIAHFPGFREKIKNTKSNVYVSTCKRALYTSVIARHIISLQLFCRVGMYYCNNNNNTSHRRSHSTACVSSPWYVKYTSSSTFSSDILFLCNYFVALVCIIVIIIIHLIVHHTQQRAFHVHGTLKTLLQALYRAT